MYIDPKNNKVKFLYLCGGGCVREINGSLIQDEEREKFVLEFFRIYRMYGHYIINDDLEAHVKIQHINNI